MDVYLSVPISKNALTGFSEHATLKSYHIAPESKFFLGKLCKNNHEAVDSSRTGLGFSVRYQSCGSCVKCNKASAKRSQYSRKDEIGQKELAAARARARLEDMQIAKEMGLTLEEYFS